VGGVGGAGLGVGAGASGGGADNGFMGMLQAQSAGEQFPEMSVNAVHQLAQWAEQLVDDVVDFTSTATAGASGVDAAVVERVTESGGNIAQLMARTATSKSKGQAAQPAPNNERHSFTENLSGMASSGKARATKAAGAIKKRLSLAPGAMSKPAKKGGQATPKGGQGGQLTPTGKTKLATAAPAAAKPSQKKHLK